MLTKKITDDFTWVGTLDPNLRVFDIVVETEFGTSYNSYLLQNSDKNVLFEASKERFFDDYIKTVEEIVPIKDIDYLVLNHTEPDHTGTIEKMLEMNPDMQVVASMGGINFLKEIVNKDFNAIAVKDGQEIDLGNRTMKFIMAPNLHWPDTMFTYIPEEQIMVTCDAFGCHYCDANVTNDDLDDKQQYLHEIAYYFDSILAPFRADVRKAIEKVKDLDIKYIATGHGPVIVENPQEVIDIYKNLAQDKNPNTRKTVIIPYVSAYGYTELLSEKIAEGIKSAGDIDVKIYDMNEEDESKVMEEIHYADGFLLGTPTMVGEAMKPIWDMVSGMNAKMYGGKLATAFGSYGWSGEGVPHIIGRLEQIKVKPFKDGLKFRFKPSDEEQKVAVEFGKEFGLTLLEG